MVVPVYKDNWWKAELYKMAKNFIAVLPDLYSNIQINEISQQNAFTKSYVLNLFTV